MISCELCFPGAVEIGELAPDVVLVFDDGGYCLIWGHGHNDGVLLTFQIAPWTDPDPDCTGDLTLNEEGLADQWIDDVESALIPEEWNMPPDVGHAFCLTCEKVGWPSRSHRLLHQWVFDRAGTMIAKWKEQINVDSNELHPGDGV